VTQEPLRQWGKGLLLPLGTFLDIMKEDSVRRRRGATGCRRMGMGKGELAVSSVGGEYVVRLDTGGPSRGKRGGLSCPSIRIQ